MERVVEGVGRGSGYFAWVQTPMSATRLSGIEGLDDVAALPHVAMSPPTGDREIRWTRAMGGRSNGCQVFGSVEVNVAELLHDDQIDDAIRLDFEEDLQEAGSSRAP